MADNTTLNPGTGGDVVATDDIGGVKYQRVKLVLGSDGVNGGDVHSGNPVPVSVGNFPTTQAVSGTIALDSATLAALESITATVSGTVNVGNFPATQVVSATDLDIRNLSSAQDSVAVSGTVALDSASLAALETVNANVSGSVSVSNFPATQAVSGTVSVNNFPATQAVSGTVTANLGTLNGAATAANQTTTNNSLSSIDGKLPDVSGTWGYLAGTSGTVSVAANKRILQITAAAQPLLAASMTINGGQTITIPAGASVTITPKANLVAPTIVFTSTATYFVEFVE
jgi:hypothetical protein